MRAATLVIALLCTALAGCAGIPNPYADPFAAPVAGYRYFFPEPAIVQVSASAEIVVYEYSRLYGDDFPLAVAAADRQCKTYARSAQVVSLVAKNQDRSWATFVCR